jgi:hypothetical protein
MQITLDIFLTEDLGEDRDTIFKGKISSKMYDLHV